jgi:hypothetical protein
MKEYWTLFQKNIDVRLTKKRYTTTGNVNKEAIGDFFFKSGDALVYPILKRKGRVLKISSTLKKK